MTAALPAGEKKRMELNVERAAGHLGGKFKK